MDQKDKDVKKKNYLTKSTEITEFAKRHHLKFENENANSNTYHNLLSSIGEQFTSEFMKIIKILTFTMHHGMEETLLILHFGKEKSGEEVSIKLECLGLMNMKNTNANRIISN